VQRPKTNRIVTQVLVRSLRVGPETDAQSSSGSRGVDNQLEQRAPLEIEKIRTPPWPATPPRRMRGTETARGATSKMSPAALWESAGSTRIWVEYGDESDSKRALERRSRLTRTTR